MANWVNNYVVIECEEEIFLDRLEDAINKDLLEEIMDVPGAFLGIEMDIKRRPGTLLFCSQTKWRPPQQELDAIAERCRVTGYFSEWQMQFYAIRWEGGWTRIQNPALDAPLKFWDYMRETDCYHGPPHNPSQQDWEWGCEGKIAVCSGCFQSHGACEKECKPYTSSPLRRETYELGFTAIIDFMSENFVQESVCLQGWSDETGPVFGFDEKSDAALFTLRYANASAEELERDQKAHLDKLASRHFESDEERAPKEASAKDILERLCKNTRAKAD